MLVCAIVAVGAEIAIPLLTKSMIDGAISHGERGLLLPIGAAAVGLGVGQALLNFLRRWMQASAVTGMEQSMRADIYAHLQRLPPAFHDDWQSGQLLSRATTDLSAIRRFAGFGTIFLVTNIVTFIAVVLLLIRLNWWLGLITATVFLPVVAASTRFQQTYRVLSRRAQDQQGDLATYVEEAATGIRVLKALGRGDEAAGRHRGQALEVFGTELQKARLRSTFWAGLDLIPNALIGLLLLLGAIATSRHELTLGGLVAFITLTLQLVWPIESMGYILAGGQEAATSAQRVFEILDTPPAITSPAGPRARTAGRTAARRARPARLVFDHVGFRYPGAEQALLRDVSLAVEPGQTMVLAGATGAGKTTLLQLVPRLADVTSGAVLLDGTDVRRLPLPMLRSRVGCAFEDPTLFSASVRENVAYGTPDADDAAIEAALAMAQAGFVHDLPWGLDTRIGEQGMALSGGQRQRVALARAILARPSLLILDDPLSALDVHTEARVTKALSGLLAETTALVVAHRPSTVTLADKVALLRDGVIAATGTHAHLLASQPRYRRADERPGRARHRRAGGVMTTDAWRGIAAEDADEVTGGLAALLRRRARRLLFSLLRPQRARVAVTFVLIVTANLAALAGPWLVGVAIDRGIPPLLHGGNLAPLALYVAGFAAAVAIQAVASRGFIYSMGKLGETVVLELRQRLFLHFQRLPVSFHEHYTSGRVISRQVSDIDSISDLFDDGLDALVSAALSLILVGAGMLLLDWPLALVVLAGFVPLAWLTIWFRRESAAAYRRTRETIAQVIVHFVETFGGIRAVQAFRREERNEEIFGSLNGSYAAASLSSSRALAVYAPGITLVGNVATGRRAVLRRAAGDRRRHQGRGAGHVPAVPGPVLRPAAGPVPVLQLLPVRGRLPGEDLRRAGGAARGARARAPRAAAATRHGPSAQLEGREVRFEAVRFGYRDTAVLPGLDLTIPAAQTVALVGATGAGKTTVARLLARFYDPGQGSVQLDGVDLRDLPDRVLRQEVVLVTQENFVFTGSVADNIRLGRPDATQAEVEAAARAIGADAFISALPGGYQADVGKRGGRLSAGQRQLVAFARAFLAAPSVLVLDEATSLLDIPSEQLVQGALRTVLAGRTAMIIAHRLSTVEIADRVLVLSAGQVVEDGPPARLLASDGEYSALHTDWRDSLA